MKKKTLKINKKEFVQWYFDKDTFDIITEDIWDEMMEDGKYTIDLQDVWKRLGYIQLNHIKNKKVVDKKHITEDGYGIEEPSYFYKAEFV